jgi:hypothetical protein
MTAVNVSSVTVNESAGKAINLYTNEDITGVYGYTYAAPSSTPYRVAILLQRMSTGLGSAGYVAVGWGDADGKFVFILITEGGNIYVYSASSFHVLDSNLFSEAFPFPYQDVWFGLRNDGTNCHYEISRDGVNFVPLYSETVGTYLADRSLIFWGAYQNTPGYLTTTLRCYNAGAISPSFP